MLDRTVNYSYSLNDFEDDEKAAILEAKQEAVKNFPIRIRSQNLEPDPAEKQSYIKQAIMQ